MLIYYENNFTSFITLCDHFPVIILIMTNISSSYLTSICFEESKDSLIQWEEETLLKCTWNIVKGLFTSMSPPCIYHSRSQISIQVSMGMRGTHSTHTCSIKTLQFCCSSGHQGLFCSTSCREQRCGSPVRNSQQVPSRFAGEERPKLHHLLSLHLQFPL